jgi:uncharacterized protein
VAIEATNMTQEWKDAVRRGSIDELQHLVATGADVDARDGHGQTALMLAAVEGHDHVVEWLVERGAVLDHTAKYGLSAVMLGVVNGHVDVVQALVRTGANLGLRGTGAPGFAGKTALDLAVARDDQEMVDILRSRAGPASG